MNKVIIILLLCIVITTSIKLKIEPYSVGNPDDSTFELEPNLQTLQDFTKYAAKGENGDLGAHLLEKSGKLWLGSWDSGLSGSSDNGEVQLLLSGKHKIGANGQKNHTTYKLKIEGYNNDGSVVYPILCRDENKNIDFYVKNRAPNTPSELYMNGNIKVNDLFVSNKCHLNELTCKNNGLFLKDVNVNGNIICNNRNLEHHLVPKGTIIAFYKNTGIPYGWVICDGRTISGFGKTPDLRGRFILHESSNFKINTKGGSANHKLTVDELPSHNHYIHLKSVSHSHSGNTNDSGSHSHAIPDYKNRFKHSGSYTEGTIHNAGKGIHLPHRVTFPNGIHKHSFKTNTNTQSHNHAMRNTGGNKFHNNMPPYFSLIYIIKCI